MNPSGTAGSGDGRDPKNDLGPVNTDRKEANALNQRSCKGRDRKAEPIL